MEAKLNIADPSTLKATLALTMTVKEWDELADQLQNVWPSIRLTEVIRDLNRQLRKTYYPSSEPEA